ncbi:MAG: tetratricopeptide repeat protein [bacterium]|nr:tetratricopeptide repeat protein [bacterium]
MKKIILIALIGLFVVTFSNTLMAQEGRGSGRLKGLVYDIDKNPIEGVKLTLKYVEFNRTLTATSDKKGKFVFNTLGKGTVQVKAEKEGYASEGLQFPVSGAQKNPKQFITMKKPEEKDPTITKNKDTKDSYKQALQLFNDRKFQESLDMYVKCRELQPQLYKIGTSIGTCYLELKQYDEAVKEYQVVLDKMKAENPDLTGNVDAAQVYSCMGEVYMRQDKFADAEKYFKLSIEIDKSDYALAYNVAEILFVAGKTDDAIKYYEMAIEIKPDWANTYKQLGYAYLNKGDTKKAVETFKKFMEMAPDSPDVAVIQEVVKSLQ